MLDDALKKLNNEIEGHVRFDLFSKRIYSIDASIYKIEPIAVALPKSANDVNACIEFARSNQISITSRGAGTGTTGGGIGNGLIIDFSKYMNHVLDIDVGRETVLCQPGVVQDELNNALAAYGYRLGPDTSSGNRATIGGMVGNNASGMYSMRYGKMVDAVLAIDLALSTGDTILCEDLSENAVQQKLASTTQEAEIYSAVTDIRDTLADEIEVRFPAIQRRVSGYNFDELIKARNLNLAKLVVGSEGTLGVATEVTLKIVSTPRITGICIGAFDDIGSALSMVPDILRFEPLALELIDKNIIQAGRESPALAGKLGWLDGVPACLLIVELESDSRAALESVLQKIAAGPFSSEHVAQVTVSCDSAIAKAVWQLRKAGLGLLLARRTNERAVAFMEDIAIPPENLANWIGEFRSLIHSYGKEAGIYGHAGVGCLHIRPMLDLHQSHDVDIMFKLMNDVSDMVLKYGGAMSGEHGDGLIRSWLNEKIFGPKIYKAFERLKDAFDPGNQMNPGKIVYPADPHENLRISPNTVAVKIENKLDFSSEGGFEFAVGMCNGNGECRKLRSGTMCPSYQVTLDEYHSTRARAQSFMAVLDGDIPLETFTSTELRDVLDLCLGCKGCKKECPSQVDMAKMKSEFLYHYHKKHGTALRDHIFGSVDLLGRLGAATVPISNLVIASGLAKKILHRIGIDPRRTMPAFAGKRFSRSRHCARSAKTGQTNRVVLFVDTFTEFYHPEIGAAAIEVLDHLNCHVVVGQYKCCGKPLIAKGLLDEAQSKARRVVDSLYPYAKQGYRIIGLEPSCILALKDDYPALLYPCAKAVRVAEMCCTVDYYLSELIQQKSWNPRIFQGTQESVMLHGHCHQKAIEGSEPTRRVLAAIPGVEVTEIDSGCCGMAGSFGYEREHYDISQRIGELRLFPALRNLPADTRVIANGISCRQQISGSLKINVQHLVEILADRLA